MEGDHAHCLSCVNHRCVVRLQPGVSCDLITCPLQCGAVFHSCKVDEHNLLCPLLRVPCLNSGYGCPVILGRDQMYAHLEVCPAGVVCCTMEWNRWPVSSPVGDLDCTSYESLCREVQRMEQLDAALALQDQCTLLESFKVISVAPATKSASPEAVPEGSTCTELPSESASPHPTPVTLPGPARERTLRSQQLKMEDKAVDTSDVGPDDDLFGLGGVDLITAALLFHPEEARACQRISDPVYVGGCHVHFGTQTFTLPATVLQLLTITRVSDMASASACDHGASLLSHPNPFRIRRLDHTQNLFVLHYNRSFPMFPFVCGQSFRRDQFSSHFSNVHGDIHAGLNGWMEHRCPLAYYGCTFSQRRFYPSSQGAKVVHDRHLRSFGVRPCPGAKLADCSQSDQFSRLPIEILWHIADFLDSFSLCQLSLVSRPMREVCASLLQTRGIVELQWERRQWPGAHGTVSWQIKNKVWRFSTAFSPVLNWGYSDLPSMSDHLKKCQFNTVEHRTEIVPLPAMCGSQ